MRLATHPSARILSAQSSKLVSIQCAGIARRRRSVILLCRRAKKLMKDGLQLICPYLIPLDRGMQLVSIHHPFEKPAVAVCKPVIDVEIADFFAVGQL